MSVVAYEQREMGAIAHVWYGTTHADQASKYVGVWKLLSRELSTSRAHFYLSIYG